MLVLWLGLLACSTSARLHHYVCDDAQRTAHDCVFTSIAKQQVWTVCDTPTIFLPSDHPVLDLRPFVPTWISIQDVRLSPGRAPPGLPSHT